jgi:hypothetical protein
MIACPSEISAFDPKRKSAAGWKEGFSVLML